MLARGTCNVIVALKFRTENIAAPVLETEGLGMASRRRNGDWVVRVYR
jgi:hypothetical protein